MPGNDVVDLGDPESRPESFRPRFDERVFTPEERRSIARDPSPLVRRWAYWAAKEAAFKLAKQFDSDLVFAPGRLNVRFDPVEPGALRRAPRKGVVERVGLEDGVSSGMIEVRSFETEEHVHVVALPAGADWGAADFVVEPLPAPETDPSIAVRKLAIREISRSLGVDRERLSIGRKRTEASRLPTVELDGVTTSLSLSLSHHGRWICYAMTPTAETDRVMTKALNS